MTEHTDVILELRAAAIDGHVPDEAWARLRGTMPRLRDRGDGTMDVTVACPAPASGGPVLLSGGWLNGGGSGRLLQPVEGTDVLARTWTVSAALLSTYQLWTAPGPLDVADDHPGLLQQLESFRMSGDPLAREVLQYPHDPENPGEPMAHPIVRGPLADHEPWLAPRPGVVPTELVQHRFTSAILGKDRRIWTHVPTTLDPSEPAPLLVVWDGGIYAHVLSCPTILDHLVAAGEIPPMVTVFVHWVEDGSRNWELAGAPEFDRCVEEELLPWIAERFHVTDDPARTIMSGSSLGGLASVRYAYLLPHRVGNAIAQSGSFGWHPEEPDATDWLAERWAVDGPVDCRLWTEMGTYETMPGPDGRSGYEHTQQFVEVARTRGTDITYRDFVGGHDYLCWRASFPEALRSIVARW
jgi:enterochelin esterase family protein